MSLPPEILAQILSSDEGIDDLLKRYGQRIANIVPALLQFLRDNRGQNGLLSTSFSSAKFVEKLLKDSGIGSLLTEAAPLLEEIASQAEATLSILGEASQPSAPAIRAAVGSSFDALRSQLSISVGALTQTIQSEMLTMTLIPRSLEASAAIFADAYGTTTAQAKTILNTSLAQVQRTVHLSTLSSFDDEDAFVVYVGPNDEVIRPFCSVLEGKAIRKKDLGRLDNGQGLPVPFHGGGWNCRHSLLPVSGAFVEENGIDVASNDDIQTANARAQR